MSANSFDLAWIVVNDLKKAIDFYTNVIGLKLMEFHAEYGWAELEGKKGGAKIGIAQRQVEEESCIQPGQNAVITFTVDNLEKAIATLVEKGATLLGKIENVGGGARPNLMFFDIQNDEITRFDAIVKAAGAPVLAQAPIITMRLSAIKGQSVDTLLKEGHPGVPAWTLTREYRSTYRSSLFDTEKITAGKFIGRVTPGEPRVPVSMEESLAKDLQLTIGDEVTFDVQGVPVTGYVASLRAVEWQRVAPNFFVVFPEGVLEPAPKTFVAAVRGETPADTARILQAVVKELPSVSSVDLALIMQTIDGIFSKVAFVVSFLAFFTVVTGVIVLVGAILTGRLQRIRETVLLRTLGATQRRLRQILLVEYAVLGVLSALTGGLLSIGGAALVAKYRFNTTIIVPPLVLFGSIAAAVAVTLITGLITNRGVASHPPLEVLREET